MKSLTSLLAALSVYLLLLGAVLYSYRSRPHPAVAESSRRTEIITLGIIGESGTQETPRPSIKKPEKPAKTPPRQAAEKSDRKREAKNSAEKRSSVKSPKPEELTEGKKSIPPISRHALVTKPKEVPKHLPEQSHGHKKYALAKVTPRDPTYYMALKVISTDAPENHQRKKRKKFKRPTRTHSKNTHNKRTRKRGAGSSHHSRYSATNASRFLYRLKKRINRNKNYPRVARRRGITGSVRVSFTILRNGSVGAISARGPRIFHASAKNAVKRAFPVNPAKASHTLPWQISVLLRYQLRQAR